MKKTIRIDNLRDVQVGDMLFVKERRDGFRVARAREGSLTFHVNVDNPVGDYTVYVMSNRFDHAERTVEEPEWPHPGDIDMHVYLGADGKKYLYMPTYDCDSTPWRRLPNDDWRDADGMTECYPAALPLTEFKLVPIEEES